MLADDYPLLGLLWMMTVYVLWAGAATGHRRLVGAWTSPPRREDDGATGR